MTKISISKLEQSEKLQIVELTQDKCEKVSGGVLGGVPGAAIGYGVGGSLGLATDFIDKVDDNRKKTGNITIPKPDARTGVAVAGGGSLGALTGGALSK